MNEPIKNKTMKVKIKDLKPNPFRNIENYPINSDKVDKLKRSIEETGFWDNVIARSKDGDIQIAYGHHRLRALHEVYTPDFQIEVPIKDLSDEIMFKVMANENMAEWDSSIAVIDETVMGARENLPKFRKIDKYFSAKEVAKFLSWDYHTVQEAFTRLNDIEDKILDKDSVTSMSNEHQAQVFGATAKKVGLDIEQQKKVAKKVKAKLDSEDGVSAKDVKELIYAEAFPTPEKPVVEKDPYTEKVASFEDHLQSMIYVGEEFTDNIAQLNKMRAEITNYTYENWERRIDLELMLKALVKTTNDLITNLKIDIDGING